MDDVSRAPAQMIGGARPRGAVAFFVRALVGGGAQRDMILLANAFAAREERPVELFTLVPSGPLRALVDQRVTIVTVPGGQLRSALPGLRRTLKTRRPAVLVGAEAAANVLVLLATRLLPRGSRPLVVLREVSSPSIGRRHDPYRQTRLAYAALRLLYRWADVVVTLTEGARRDLRDNFGVPDAKLVRATSNAVIGDAREVERGSAEKRDPDLVVSVGRLSDEKDHATLLDAFARLDRPDTRLAIYGTGPTEAAIARRIVDLGLGGRVTLEGFVADPFPVFRRAALMVSSSRFEGFGNVIVEALSCGTPVVATECPYGPAEILEGGRYGRLVPVGDADAMARAISAALGSVPDRAALRARAAIHTVDRAAAVLAEIVATTEARIAHSKGARPAPPLLGGLIGEAPPLRERHHG